MADISHVTDTALWVAWHRGRETDRPDALYRDPLAIKLAGDRGARIAETMASSDFMTWMMALRTKAIDDFLTRAVDAGATTIINLGAGLDTRPYRMSFKTRVKWFEADFPGMVAYKDQALSGETPKVSLVRRGMDLSDSEELRGFLSSALPPGEVAVVLTEGVIPYLDNDEVDQLADVLWGQKQVRFWIQDFRHGGYAQGVPALWFRLKMRRAPMKFKVGDWFGYFGRFGWTVACEARTYDLAMKYHRPMPSAGLWSWLMAIVPRRKFRMWMTSAGFVMLTRPNEALR